MIRRACLSCSGWCWETHSVEKIRQGLCLDMSEHKFFGRPNRFLVDATEDSVSIKFL